jgi:hypothetical protein
MGQAGRRLSKKRSKEPDALLSVCEGHFVANANYRLPANALTGGFALLQVFRNSRLFEATTGCTLADRHLMISKQEGDRILDICGRRARQKAQVVLWQNCAFDSSGLIFRNTHAKIAERISDLLARQIFK